MKRLYTLLVLLLAATGYSHAQFTRYVIKFTDKKGTTYSLTAPSAWLSNKAIARRTNQHISYDSTDLPVSPAYLDSIRKVPNVTVLNVSKWLNQVLIKTSDANALTKINSFPFVKKTNGLAPRLSVTTGTTPINKFDDEQPVIPASNGRLQGVTGIEGFDYGNNYDQIHIHEGEYLHDQGFTGRGMTIAVLDAGFKSYLTNPVFDSVRLQNRILGTWDYVVNEASVNEDHPHGAYVFSVLAANRPGVMVGAAPHASYWLLRTEDAATEYPVEEQNWAAAAEFADSAGVDMISTSLGYIYEDSSFSYTYAQRNGNTAMISIAAKLAVKKGILVVAAAGNNGGLSTNLKYVGCPADADSVLTIGSIDKYGNIAASSSWGPNGAGLLKPNVVSVGQGAIVAAQAGTTFAGNGTSFACPNMAGLVCCLWQAFPDFTNMEIFDAVQKSASKYNSPDYRFGYGIPNFHTAYTMLESLREARNKDNILSNRWIKAYPVPFTSGFKVLLKAPETGRASVRLSNVIGQVIETRVLDVTQGEVYFLDFSNAQALAKGVYYIKYTEGSVKQTLTVVRR